MQATIDDYQDILEGYDIHPSKWDDFIHILDLLEDWAKRFVDLAFGTDPVQQAREGSEARLPAESVAMVNSKRRPLTKGEQKPISNDE